MIYPGWRVARQSMILTIASACLLGQSQTVTSLTATPSTANLGLMVTLTATVAPSTASGKVTFYDGSHILGIATVASGRASLSTVEIAYGKQALTARYGGDSQNSGSVSPVFIEHVVTKAGGALVAGTGAGSWQTDPDPWLFTDLNHDGVADVVSLGGYNSSSLTVHLGNYDGSFQNGQTFSTSADPQSVAAGDFDMDGNPDLAVVVTARDFSTRSLTTLIGNGDGTFRSGADILDDIDIYGVWVADINMDGKPDLVILRQNIPAVEVLFGNGDGTFQTSSPLMLPFSGDSYNLLVADFNGDGFPDVAVANAGADSVTVFLATGPGTFASPVNYLSFNASSISTGDLNNDGIPDLLVGGGTSSFDLLLGAGDGTFSAARTVQAYAGPSYSSASPITPYDFDGDGNADVIASGSNGGILVVPGNGDGTFRAPLNLPGGGGIFGVGDLNHDSIPDLLIVGGAWPIQPYLGAVSPIFTVTASPDPPMFGQSATLSVTCNYPDATGTLTFLDFEGTGTPLGTAPLAQCKAIHNVGVLPTGPHFIQTTYSGDSKYAPTSLPSVYFEVQQPIGTLTLTASPNPAVAGQPVTLTATIPSQPGNPLISFFDGTSLLNAQTLYSKTATFTTTLPAGVHQLTALFPPYQGYLPTSATLVENVLATPGGSLVSGPSYQVSGTITQAVALDLNRDGLPDLMLVDAVNNQLVNLTNAGKGVFQSPVTSTVKFVPGAVVALGIDNYYDYSAYALTESSGNAVDVYENYAPGLAPRPGVISGPGRVSVGQQPVAIASADFDRDGLADMVTANAGSNNVTLILSGALHIVNLPAGNYPDAVAAGDFNHDGIADFVVANRDDNNIMVFLGNGDGTFKSPVTTSAGSGPMAVVAGDLNGDFKTDLVIIDGVSQQATILVSSGDGTFQAAATYTLGSSPSAAVLADMNGDNKLDLVVTTAAGLLIFNGKGDGTFAAAVNYQQYAGATSVAAATFSEDGRMDLAITLPGSVTLLINGAPTTTALSVTPATSSTSQKITLKATISPAGAAGFAAFYDGVTPIGGGPVANSTGSFSTTLLPSGLHSISARFTGGPGYGASVSSAVSLNISPVRSTGFSGPTRQTFATDAAVNLIPGDFNKDGLEDFAFWRDGNGLIVLLGNGDGTFKEGPPELASGGNPAVTGDFNNDGNTDIAYILGGLALATGDGKGNFVESTVSGNGVALATADFNLDGHPDLVMANPAGTADVLLGIGDGTFQNLVSHTAGTNPVLAGTGDFNGDGKPDIIMANYIMGAPGSAGSGQLTFLAGLGNGGFGPAQPISLPGVPVSMVLADFNGDGKLDVAIAQSGSNSAAIMLGKGDGTFAAPLTTTLGGTPLQLLTADMDGDGRPDLVVMFETASPVFAIFYGNGDGTFTAPVKYSDVQAPSAIAVGDVNGDGSPDVVVAEGNTINVFSAIQMVATPTSIFVDAASQTFTVQVATCEGCAWSVTASGGFITINSGATGSGNGTVTLLVTANVTGIARTGTLTIGRQTIPVTQRDTTDIFADVAPSNYYFDFANVMYADHITSGCSSTPLDYCPDSTTTRGQMAVFIITGIEGSNAFTYTTTPYFTDVPPSNPFFKFIQKLKDLGITSGCTATSYCPDDPVTRAEMAVFVIVARYGAIKFTYPTTPYFTDVPPSNMFFPFIQKMAQDGITAGCGGGLYCPDISLSRGQMAMFIVTGLLNELLAAGTPVISQVAPNSAAPGQTVTVTITGVGTHFAQGTTQVTVPSGVTVSGVNVTSATSLTAQFTISLGAVLSTGATNGSPYSIVVTTDNEEADLPNGFLVQ